MPINWEDRTRMLWPILTELARLGEKRTYGKLAPCINTNALSVGGALDPIQNYCLDNRLPPLNALAINKQTRVPGSGFIAWDIDTLDEAYPLVFAYDWSRIPNPFDGFTGNNTSKSLASQLVKDPDCSGEVYSRVRNWWAAQKIFRLALLEAYAYRDDYRCAVCGLSFEETLEAAHIISWTDSASTQELRMDPRNGILLCSTHHKLFDNYYFTINEDYQIVYYDPEMKGGEYFEMDKHFVVHFHMKSIRLPKNKMLHPDKHLLKQRTEGWQKEIATWRKSET